MSQYMKITKRFKISLVNVILNMFFVTGWIFTHDEFFIMASSVCNIVAVLIAFKIPKSWWIDNNEQVECYDSDGNFQKYIKRSDIILTNDGKYMVIDDDEDEDKKDL